MDVKLDITPYRKNAGVYEGEELRRTLEPARKENRRFEKIA
jgi:hypothetical protein